MPEPFGRRRELAYASGNIGVEVLGPILAWIPYLYAPPADAVGATALLSASSVGLLLFAGRFVDGFAEPVVGYLSDRARTRFGRRIPFVALGTPVLCAAYLALFFPPFGPGRPLATGLYLWLVNTLFWCAFTAVVAPYLALLPEIAPTSRERTRISAFMTGFQLVVVIGANVVLGRVVAAFRGGGEVLGVRFANGFEPQALAYAALAALCFYLSIAFVRERPAASLARNQLSFRTAIAESFRNPAFLPLAAAMSVFLVGVNVVVTAVPYFGRAVLRASEAEASLGTALVFGAAAATLPFVGRLVARLGKKRVYSLSLLAIALTLVALPALVLSPSPAATYLGLMLVLGVPVGGLLVLGRVLIADVIDADQVRTGLRREAMYFGMQGLLTKVSFGLGPLLATQLFTWFGNTAEQPLGILLCGPVAGALALGGWLIFRRYPLG
jgi:GPH family glycoside/pentoside/hexuronide:cation symporter